MTPKSNIAYSRYAAIMLGLPGLMMVVSLVAGLYFGPFGGDLTRIGGYPEREFAPRQSMRAFEEPQYEASSWEDPADVLVLGDSFSMETEFGWPAHLRAKTGMTVQVRHLNEMTWDDVLTSPVYVKSPPSIVIFEAVERQLQLVLRTAGKLGECPPSRTPPTALPTPQRAVALSLGVARFEPLPPWWEIDLQLASSTLIRMFNREVIGMDLTKTRSLSLKTASLFSNRNSDTLLVFLTDLNKPRFQTPENLARVECAIRTLANRVRSHGHWFVALLAPDKLTAYEPYLSGEQGRGLSRLTRLMDSLGPNLAPRVDQAVNAAIAGGTQDVYLPNDTHWSPLGHEIAAGVVVDALVEQGALVPSSAGR